MNIVLSGLISTRFINCYLDDILLCVKSNEMRFEKLITVFLRFSRSNLSINLKKCHLFEKELDFLGFTIDKTEVKPNLSKVKEFTELKGRIGETTSGFNQEGRILHMAT